MLTCTIEEKRDTVEEGDEKQDFVKLGELYNEYSEAYKALQKDKKAFKNRGSFQTGVARVLKKDTFVKNHAYINGQGVRTSANSVLIGYKKRRLQRHVMVFSSVSKHFRLDCSICSRKHRYPE